MIPIPIPTVTYMRVVMVLIKVADNILVLNQSTTLNDSCLKCALNYMFIPRSTPQNHNAGFSSCEMILAKR